MKEIIAKVMQAETEGKNIVEAAKAEAEQVLLDSRGKAQEFTNRIRRETQIEISKLDEESLWALQQEKQSCLARWVAEIEAQFPLDQPARQQAVIAGIKCICDFDGEEKEPENISDRIYKMKQN